MSNKSPFYDEVIEFIRRYPNIAIDTKWIRKKYGIPGSNRSASSFIALRLEELCRKGILEETKHNTKRFRITKEGKAILDYELIMSGSTHF